ncbi:MAG: hypothetical protein QXE33_03030 [Candidatus Micrarchaeaceae archaeon]
MKGVEKKSATGIYVLEIIASLVYIWETFFSGGANANGTAMGLLQPIVYAVAAVSSVALFFLSIGGIMWGWNAKILNSIRSSFAAGSIALIALTVANFNMAIVIVGFIIGLIGVMYADMKE